MDKGNARVLNWGLLSTARINRSLIPPLRQSKRNRLAAVASRDLNRARAYASEWKIPKAYGSYDELLADPDIDVIYNPLPNDMHAEWSIKAANAGKSVLCEKPLALSLAEVDAMIDAALKNGVVISEAFMYRHHPQTKRVQEIVDSGQLGKVVLIKGSFSFDLDRPDDIRWNPAMGGGSLWDVGCYPVSYSLMIAGVAPTEVMGWQAPSESGVDLHFAGQLRFPEGIMAQFDSSFGLPFNTYMEIRGTEGSLFIPTPFKPERRSRMVLKDRDGKETKISVPGPHLYLGEVEDMASALLEGKTPLVSLEQSRLHIATLLALLESAKKDCPVPM